MLHILCRPKRNKIYRNNEGSVRFTHSLRFKLVAINITCTLIPTVIITLFCISYFKQQTQLEADVLVSNTLKSVSQNIYSYISELEKLMTTVGYDKKVLNTLEENNLNDIKTFSGVNGCFKSNGIENYLKTSGKNLLSIIVQNEDGGLQYYNKNVNVDLDLNRVYISSPYDDLISQIELPREPFIFIGAHEPVYFTFSANKRVFTVIQSMKHPYKTNSKIFIMADTDIAFFQDLFTDLKFSSPSVSLVLDDNGEIVYSDSPISDEMQELLAHDFRVITLEGTTYRVFSQAIIPSGWKVVILLSDSTLRAKIQWICTINTLVAVLVIIITSLTFTTLSNSITNSFREMTHVMRLVKNGDLNTSCNVYGDDELSELKRSLNDMIQKLNNYIDKEYKLLLSQRNAEYRALQSQIQPHFLYNVLNGFLWLNREGQRDVLEDSIVNLSGLMRYTLGSDTMVTIGKEFNFLYNYCELQKLRFEEKMNFSIFCSDSVSNFKIPKLILQPLVENSVIHAVEPSDGTCSIMIKAYMVKEGEDSYVHITIADDGTGFDITQMNHSNSVGITNVKERLKLMYTHSLFDIESNPESGTCISIKIFVDDIYTLD